MAKVQTFNASKLLIKIGDGGDPEAFAHPCVINASRSIQISVSTVDTVVPDCEDPDAPAFVEREKDSISMTITGEGKMHAADISEYLDWIVDKDPKNCEIVIADGDAAGQVVTGVLHLTEFQVSGDRKEKATASITLVSTGPFSHETQA